MAAGRHAGGDPGEGRAEAVPGHRAAPTAEQRRRGSLGWAVVGTFGEILITLGLLCGLYVLWQLNWTGVEANQAQAAAVAEAEWVQPPPKIATRHTSEPPVLAEPHEDRTLIGRVYVPRFGADYERTLVQGTDKKSVLDLMGYGHYEGTAMPGGIGNFSAAAHRDGSGEPLGRIDELRKGDALIIRTKDTWYVYDMTTSDIVAPTQVDVIAPVPGEAGEQPTERMLTFTTCHPKYTSRERFIVHAQFAYWAPVSEGIPQELYDAGATSIDE